MNKSKRAAANRVFAKIPPWGAMASGIRRGLVVSGIRVAGLRRS